MVERDDTIDNVDTHETDDNDSSHSLPITLPKTISSQLVFGQDQLKSSASFDSLGALYDAQWTPKFRFGARKVSSAQICI